MAAPSTLTLISEFRKDLRDYAKTGKAGSLYNWANLFFRTNGAVNDVTSMLLRLRHERTRYSDTSGLLGTMSTKDRAAIVSALRKDSYYVFPKLMPDSILNAIENAARPSPARIFPQPDGTDSAIFDPDKPIAPTYWWGQSLVNLPETQALMTDETFTAIATDYLRVDPILDSAQAWLSVPYGTGPSHESAQLYHFDLSHLGWLKIYVYLTDVGTNNGPHCLVKGTHRADDLKGAALRRRGQVRISDEDIASVYGKDREVEITGPRGTVFAVDTRAFHKGKPPVEGERIMFELYYVVSDYGVTTPPEPISSPTQEYREASKRWPRLLSHFKIFPKTKEADNFDPLKLELSNRQREAALELLRERPNELLKIPAVRDLVSTDRHERLTKAGNFSYSEFDNADVLGGTVTYNQGALDHHVTLDRLRFLLGPMLSITEIARNQANLRILLIGPRTEIELLAAKAAGFPQENISALDLLSYSPLITPGDMHAMPYQNDTFDIVFVTCCMSYSKNAPKAVAEVIRVLKSGGHVGFIEPMHNDFVPAEHKADIPGAYQDASALDPSVPWWGTVDDVLKLFSPHVDTVNFRCEPSPPYDGWGLLLSTVFKIAK